MKRKVLIDCIDDKYFIKITTDVLCRENSDPILEVDFICGGDVVACLVQNIPDHTISITTMESVQNDIHVFWSLQEKSIKVNYFSFVGTNQTVIFLGHFFVINCIDINVKKFFTTRNYETQLDARKVNIISENIHHRGVIGRHPKNGEGRLRELNLNADYISIRGFIFAKESLCSITGNIFYCSGYFQALSIKINTQSEINIESSGIIDSFKNFQLFSRKIIHYGFLVCQEKNELSNILSGSDSLESKGEISFPEKNQVQLISSGAVYVARDYLSSGLILKFEKKPVLILEMSKKPLAKTFINQAKDDIKVYREIIANHNIPAEALKNRKILLYLLEEAIQSSSEFFPQDQLCDAYKRCLSQLVRGHNWYSYLTPFGLAWRDESRLESILRDTLWQLEHDKLTALFSEGYHDFVGPPIIDLRSPIPNYIISNILPLFVPVLGPLVEASRYTYYLARYSYQAYRLLDNNFENHEKVIALPIVAMICSTLSIIGLSQLVDTMLFECLLIEDSLKKFKAHCDEKNIHLDTTVGDIINWIVSVTKQHTFLERIAHIIILMIIAPFNALMNQASKCVQQEMHLFEKILFILKGIAISIIPSLRYVTVIGQSIEYITQEKVEDFNWMDLSCAGISYITNHFMGNSPGAHRVLNQALMNVHQATPSLPLLENSVTGGFADFVKKGESELARFLHIVSHVATEGAIEVTLKSTHIQQLFPKTFNDSFAVISLFFSDQASYSVKFSLSYLFAYVVEKNIPQKDIHDYFKQFMEADLFRQTLLKFIGKFFPLQELENDFLISVLSTDGVARTAHMKLVDFIIDMGIIYLKKYCIDFIEKNVFSEVEKLVAALSYYYTRTSDYFTGLYGDIQSGLFLNEERFLYHLQAVLAISEFSIRLIKELANEFNSSSDMQAEDESVVAVQPVSVVKASVFYSPSFAESLERKHVNFFRDPSSRSQLDQDSSWIRAGGCFSGLDRFKMDCLRADLLKLTNWSYNFHVPITSIEGLNWNWSIVTTTDECMKSSKKFRKRNTYDYRAVCVKRSDGLVAILTPGTDFDNLEYAFQFSIGTDGSKVNQTHLGFDNTSSSCLSADFFIAFGKLPKTYCKAGMIFYNYVIEKFNAAPHILSAHSLGCAFNFWANYETKGSIYILNIDPPKSGKLFSKKSLPSSLNIDTILGSENAINGSIDDHFACGIPVGYIKRVDTASICDNWASKWLPGVLFGGFFRLPLGGFFRLPRHFVKNISDAFDLEFAKVYQLEQGIASSKEGAVPRLVF